VALDGARPDGLLLRVPGDELRLSGQARLERHRDGPALVDARRQAQREEAFARFTELARSGSAGRGAAVFARTCEVCHTVAGRGQTVGPPLDGLGARGLDGILAAVLEPSAAVESGYRELRVERRDGTSVSGLLVRSDGERVVVRPATASGPAEPHEIPREDIARLRWSSLSVMPDGLLEALPPGEAADLLAFLLAL
jgi:putative heme-binding domain-containing protein